MLLFVQENVKDGMENLNLEDGGGDGEDSDEVPGLRQQRITKAQRRREKKALESKERELRITEQEAANLVGASAIELSSIKQILKERGLMIYEIPSDGNWYVVSRKFTFSI